MRELTLTAPMAGWAMSLDKVPDAVFAAGMMGPGAAIDPTKGTLCAPCDAIVLSVHHARHAITLQVADGPDLLLHVGLDTVKLDGAPFTALVTEGASVTAGAPLLRFDLDAIVRSAPAAVTPLVVTTPGWTMEPLTAGRMVSQGEPWLRVVAAVAPVSGTTECPSATISQRVTVGLPHGLHARPAARIVATAGDAGAATFLVTDDRRAACNSPTALLGLGLRNGAAVTIEAGGPRAADIIAAIADLLAREVDDAPAAPAPSPVSRPLPAGAMAAVPAAPGIAIGTARWLTRARAELPTAGTGAAAEHARLMDGLAVVDAALAETKGTGAGVAAAHRAILVDPALRQAATAAIADGAHAATAFVSAADAQAAVLRGLADRRLAERGDDIEDVGQLVAHAILGTSPAAVALPPATVLLASDLMPSQLIALDLSALAGIVLVAGGPTSHVAILAAAGGVPMLVAAGDALNAIADGTSLLIDADAGHLLPDPDAATVARVTATLAQRAKRLAKAAGTRGTTADGVAIPVQANLGSVADARAAAAVGAEGSGLVRTEFLFLDRATAPDAIEQTDAYRAMMAALPAGTITVRLLDVGGDKPAPYLDLPTEENPALGLRGVRVSLARPDLLEAQLAAIVDQSDRARCRILVPMVADAAEIERVRAVLDRLCAERGVAAPPLGAMIETPAAAIGADLLAHVCDFLSIGSNDLTQYVLAMDRGNPAVAGAIDGLHPAVLRLIAATCEGVAERGIPVGVCGGLAADPMAVPILLGLGVTSLSVPPAQVLATRAAVAAVTLERARAHARAALACPSAAAVRALALAFANGGTA